MSVSHVRALKESESGKPLRLWGGGELCGELATPGTQLSLKLKSQRLHAQSGTLFLQYDVVR